MKLLCSAPINTGIVDAWAKLICTLILSLGKKSKLLCDACLTNILGEERIKVYKICGDYVKDAYISGDKDTCKTGGNSFTSFILILRISGEENMYGMFKIIKK